ncbi:MAG: hypothetical protein KAT15_17655, partial [Bacteroidales bacterium]|nr:hypothetical protein [Bacteroidales bacterium]
LGMIYPVEGKVITSFPAYAMGSLGIVKQVFPMVRIGAGYAYAATGGRRNYTDYSGSISTDIEASSHGLGAWVSYAVVSGKRYDLSIYGRGDANITRMKIAHSIYASGYSDSFRSSLGSVSPAGTAGLELFLHFNEFSIGMDGGYTLERPGKLSHRDGGEELTDPVDPQRVLTSDWTGWRLQIKAMIWLGS